MNPESLNDIYKKSNVSIAWFQIFHAILQVIHNFFSVCVVLLDSSHKEIVKSFSEHIYDVNS